MTPEDWGTLIAAAAAALAATLAGLNLWHTNKTERLSWTRSALEGAAVDFLSACYGHRGACWQLAEIEIGEELDWHRREVRKASEAFHEQMRNSMSRMRVLGSDHLVALAEAVQSHNPLRWTYFDAESTQTSAPVGTTTMRPLNATGTPSLPTFAKCLGSLQRSARPSAPAGAS